jgi:8-oxo-dGTP diphosphatase
MGTEIEIHSAQAKILRVLLFQPAARFSQLNEEKLPNDHFAFHLKQLTESGLVKKTLDGRYELTAKGKEFANRMDTETIKLERQAKIGALIVAVRKSSHKTLYLLQKRLKQPYFGFWGFVSGKVRWGETAQDTAKRELTEETGLIAGEVMLAGIEHKIDCQQSGLVLEDKFFFVFTSREPAGLFREKFEGGENRWLTKGEIRNLPDLFPDVRLILEMVTGKGINFVEKRYTVDKY